ncbi:tail fiber protein [Lactobacillus phage Silenus]|nr:tail fiber protein [Lactobacillus phage Silenus]
MRKLYLGNGDKQFKFADTTTEIRLNALDNGSAADLTADAKVRIKNDSGYLLGISASITDNHAVITSGQLDKLPAGSYLIELWDTVDGGTAIYPSDGFLSLQINENVTGLSGGLVSSITVDDFVQQFSSLSEQLKQQVSDAVANGLKGDTGADGLSAYQIAVINGYKGSQTEWLASLVGPTGLKGEKGNPGKDFKIVKTFPSIAAMNGDGFSDGDFTMIASDVNDPDDGKLYVWNGTSFTYVADLSGSQGIKGDTGEKGDKGDKGDTGDQGLSAYQVAVNAGFSGSVDQWLASIVGAKGDKGDKGDDATINVISQADYDALTDKFGVYFIEG